MDVPAFIQIEPQLRAFLKHLCTDLSNGDLDCLSFFQPPKSSFNDLQLTDYCRVLLSNAEGRTNHRADKCLLFGHKPVRKALLGEISFVIALRNKYAHLSGDRLIHSKEQLADLLVVQRMVAALSPLFEGPQSKAQLDEKIDGLTKELLDTVVRSSMPERFDSEETSRNLIESDDGIGEVSTEISDAYGDLTAASPHEIESNSDLKIGVQAVSQRLTNIDEKLAALPDIIAGIKYLEEIVLKLKTATDIDFDKSVSEPAESDSPISLAEDPQVPMSRANEDQGEVAFSLEDFLPNDFEEDEDETSRSVPEDDGVEDRLETISRMIASLNANMRRLTQPIDLEQARDELITLRKRIWRETGTGPAANGILRRKMIDLFLESLPLTEDDARQGNLGWHIERCDQEQRAYLDDICSITSRVVH